MRTDFLRRIEDRLPLDEALIADLAPSSSDFDLNPHLPRTRPVALRPAAVLIPILDRADGLSVLLTRRAAHLKAHAGQISFPGGRVEPDDPGYAGAAVREAWEEVGLPAQHVSIVGFLEPYETVTGFQVVPVVGLVRPDFELAIDPNEVAEAFEVPLAFLMDADNHETHEVEFQGQPRLYYAIPYGDYYIWGATAAMLVNFHKRLFGP